MYVSINFFAENSGYLSKAGTSWLGSKSFKVIINYLHLFCPNGKAIFINNPRKSERGSLTI